MQANRCKWYEAGAGASLPYTAPLIVGYRPKSPQPLAGQIKRFRKLPIYCSWHASRK